MAATTTMRRVLDTVREKNPNLDILNTHLLGKTALSSVQMDSDNPEEVLQVLRTYQRLLRLCGSEDTADILLEQGMDSAHVIAAMPEHRFVREYSGLLDSEAHAADIHRAAVEVKARIKHVWANVRDTVGSQHYRATLANNINPQLVEYFEGLPTYQSLFGGLNYCECPHCRSIFGPAAYFLDLMRITDEYITDVNTHKDSDNIPAGFTLEERRPDLFELYLTCANTDTPVPYLSIVNGILERRIERETPDVTGTAQAGTASTITLAASASQVPSFYVGMIVELTDGTGKGQSRNVTAYAGSSRVASVHADWNVVPDATTKYRLTDTAYQSVSTAQFPFNLPFNLPLEEMRLYLGELQTTFATVLERLAVPQPELPGVKAIDVAREYLGLSIEEYRIVTTPDSSVAGLSASYGYDDIAKHMPFAGAGSIAFAKDSTAVTGSNGTQFTTQLKVGDQIVAQNQTRTVRSIASNTALEVETAWDTGTTAPVAYTVQPLDSIDQVRVFTERTGLSREELHALLYQELDTAEQEAGVANTFFINATGESLPPMAIQRASKGDVFDRITNISQKRLDRLNRFIRLMRETGWSAANLDWSFQSIGATEITTQTILDVAAIQRLHNETKIEVDAVDSFWHDMKTIGRVTATHPKDLFDRVFNNPALLGGKDPYGNNEPPVPFDPARPLTWNIDDRSGTNGTIRSRLTGALLVTDNDLTSVAYYLLALLGKSGNTMEMTLTNLTWLYRLTKMPTLLNMTVDEYLLLLFLVWCAPTIKLDMNKPSVCSEIANNIATIAGVMRTREAAVWLKQSPFTVYEVAYIVTGVRNEYVDPGYTESDIKPFIQNLSVLAAEARVAKDSFVFDNIDADRSAVTFDLLKKEQFISDIGIVLDKELSYDNLNFLFPLTTESFICTNVGPKASERVFNDLVAHGFIEKTSDVTGKLKDTFTPESNLDFLFTSTGAGQSRTISGYTGATRTATVQSDWSTVPDKTSLYVLGSTATEGTAQGGTKTSMTLAASASAEDGVYDGMVVVIESGVGGGQARTITAYDGTTKVAQLAADWEVVPDATSVYRVFSPQVTEGTAQGGTKDTITLAISASAENDVYVGMQITVKREDGTEQIRLIKTYDGTTRVATVDIPWVPGGNVPNNKSTYSIALALNTGQARVGTATSIQLSEAMSDKDNAYTNLLIDIVDDPLAVLRRGEVRRTLVQIQRNINHVVEVLQQYVKLQDANVVGGLAGFLGTQSDMISAMLPFVANVSDLDDYRKAFLTPIPEGGTVPPNVVVLIDRLARGVLFARVLNLSAQEVQAIVDNPEPYTVDESRRMTFANVRMISTYKALSLEFRDTNNRLLEYFASTDAEKKLVLLASITGWSRQQIATLEEVFWPGTATYREDENTVGGIARMDRVFRLSTQTGIDVYTLLQLVRISETVNTGALGAGNSQTVVLASTASDVDGAYVGMQLTVPNPSGGMQTRTIVSYNGSLREASLDVALANQPAAGTAYTVTGLALADTSNKLIHENWLVYTTLASTVLNAVDAKYDDQEFATVFAELTAVLNTVKRDALQGYAIWLMGKKYAFINSPSALYQYLLIDTEMSGCMATTRIVEGIAAVQLYMQRSRMNLEPGVTEIPIPDVWWEWMSAYRIWEANRKVFVYPENFVDPTLRRNQSTAFRALADELLQTTVSDESIDSSYRSYFDDFSVQANLVYVDSYSGIVADETTGKPVRVTFFFGRTNTEPYTFYQRTYFPDTQLWTPWVEIDLTINSPYVSPAYVFNKLFLFWVEVEQKVTTIVTNGTESKTTAYIASLKYSFFNHLHQWTAAQTLTENLVEKFTPDTYNAPDYIYPELIDPNKLFWKKPYALSLPAKTVSTDPLVQYPERILVMLGGVYRLPESDIVVPTPPNPVGMDPDKFAFDTAIYQTALRGEGTVKTGNTRPGYILLNPVRTVQPNLTAGDPYFVFLDYNTDFGDPQPYRATIDVSTDTLSVIESTNVLYDNYYGEYVYTTIAASAASSEAEKTEDAGNTENVNKLAAAAAPFALLYNINERRAQIYTVKNQPGWYIFNNGDEEFLLIVDDPNVKSIRDILVELNRSISGEPNELDVQFKAYTTSTIPFSNLKFKIYRLSTNTVNNLNQQLFSGGIDSLLTIESQLSPELPFQQYYPAGQNSLPAIILPEPLEQFNRLDFSGSYGNYFWEIFFYSPFLIANQLKDNNRFAEAEKWYRYIFNPTQEADGTEVTTSDRYWRFLPFRNITAESLTDALTNPAQIAVYNNDPFDPDAIARLRPSAYPKAIVMRYIDTLIAWGDFLFTQDTRESITQATNLYVMAADLLGKRPESVGACPVEPPANFQEIKQQYDQVVNQGTVQGAGKQTITLASTASPVNGIYNEATIDITSGPGSGQRRIIASYNGETKNAVVDRPWTTEPTTSSQYRVNGAIPQFLIQLENTPVAMESTQGVAYTDIPFNDINAYFCVPENAELVAYWDTIEDRLFKIRHCMNISGVERQLPFFEPPIDPRDLIRAAAGGGGGISLAQQIEPSIPNYRFQVTLETAKSFTSTVMQLGGSLLAALEKQNAEELSLLMNTQQRAILAMTTSIKEQQIEQVVATGDSLAESRNSAQARYTYYTALVAKGLSSGEIQNIQAMGAALAFNLLASITRTAASIGYAVPNVGSPFAMTYGGAQIGAALNAASGVFELGSFVSTYIAERSLTMAGYERRADDWQLQADLANFDIKQIDAQIAANDIQKKIAEQDLAIHLKSIEQNEEMEFFLKNKFTNKELYQWMSGRLLTLYFQTYSLAFELARSAQRAYQYELNSSKTFVNFGYWDDARKGLLAGEGLMLALNQMEKAYFDGNVRSLEIEKSVSLLQTNPKALLDLKNTGACVFELTEKMFDYDFPGHYARKIKSVSITIPAVVGPYQTIKATLTQTGNQVILQPNVDAVNFLLGGSTATPPPADVLRSNWWVNQQIAVSRGVNDTGMFELNFNDPRYLPFEGTGAVSSWRLTMPKATNRINFEAISDVIIQVLYTASDGGANFRRQVTDLSALKPFNGSQFISLRQQYSQQWFAFMNEHPDPLLQVLAFPLQNPVPPHVDNAKLTGVYVALDVANGIDVSSPTPYISFELTNDIVVDVKIGANNASTVVLPSQPAMEKTVGVRRIIFKLDDTPAALKKDGYLDPAILQNIGVIFYYKGDVQWS